MNTMLYKNRKKIIIIISVAALDMLFGFDAKFTVINMIWLFV
jgi:hypothetical protein